MLVLNDIHIGVERKGGTTPASQEALRNYLFTSFEEILYNSNESHVAILGDLFDQFEVAPRDWLQTYLMLQDCLVKGKTLTLVAGNHDWSPKGSKVSSFEMLCKVLVEQFGDEKVTVVGIDQWSVIEGGNIFALAHCSNQDVFNVKLGELLAHVKTGDRILLHANFDNNFAVLADHSLNVSVDQAKAFQMKGASLYFAHEHQARTAMGGSVVVFGNQWPTSIADCLNNDMKFAHVFNGGVTESCTWTAATSYGEVDWRELANVDLDTWQFIKVVGNASSNEAGDCISAIAKFRAKSKTFVITNGVKIEGIVDVEALPEAFEATKAFDVMEYISRHMDGPEMEMVNKLLEGSS